MAPSLPSEKLFHGGLADSIFYGKFALGDLRRSVLSADCNDNFRTEFLSSASFDDHIHDVIVIRSEKQVIGSNAWRVVAAMEYM